MQEYITVNNKIVFGSPCESLNDYENVMIVEDEPKYYVALPGPSDINFYLHIFVEGHFNFFTKKDCPRAQCRFTEQEIKSIDERYWPFAVLVEEDQK